jgi:hypothetical protein
LQLEGLRFRPVCGAVLPGWFIRFPGSRGRRWPGQLSRDSGEDVIDVDMALPGVTIGGGGQLGSPSRCQHGLVREPGGERNARSGHEREASPVSSAASRTGGLGDGLAGPDAPASR